MFKIFNLPLQRDKKRSLKKIKYFLLFKKKVVYLQCRKVL